MMLSAPITVLGQGIALHGVGPVNRSWLGGGTGMPLDAAGAIHANPAAIAALPSNEVTFGMEVLLPEERLDSSVFIPRVGMLSGSTKSESGVSPIPHIGWVHHTPDPRVTIGLGMYGIAGFKNGYPVDPTNPILSPQPPMGVGFGRIFAEAQFFQIAPTIAYALTDNLAIGVAPTVTLAQISLNPLAIAPPVGMPPQYASGQSTRYHWGGGAQAGIFYVGDAGWSFGASIKSPQWMEDFRYFTEDGMGGGRVAKFDIDYPMIVSAGLGYTGIERWIFAADVRYFAYDAVAGFGSPARFNSAGALTGLDWSSVFSVSTGVQYQLTDCVSLRVGYLFAQNPIRDSETFFNVLSPLIVQHLLAVGTSVNLTHNVLAHMYYVHGFENSVTGPFVSNGAPGLPPANTPIPSSSVTSSVAAYALGFGITVQY